MVSVKKVILIGSGIGVLIIGAAGLVFPILPGVPLVFLGLTICAGGSDRVKKWEIPGKLKNWLM